MKNIINYIPKRVQIMLLIVISMMAGLGINFVIEQGENGETIIESTFSIELSKNQVPTILRLDNGETEVIDAPTVERVESNQVIDEEELDFGRGEYHDISSPDAYRDSVLGKCIDLDGKWGSQCVDGFSDFNYQYTDRWLSTCETGTARGLWDCRDYNAGDDYILITNPHDLKSGDWIIFDGGEFGHVGMALGDYNDGYIALLGENQGGTPCVGGGSAFNIINMSLKTFKGAFRPNIYISQEPEPEPEPIPVSGCLLWHVLAGDTMSKIMLECEGTVVYGEPMDNYARSWYSLVYRPNQSVYDGWNSKTGVGLYAGDDIEHRIK